jgi:hypothetical protein
MTSSEVAAHTGRLVNRFLKQKKWFHAVVEHLRSKQHTTFS